MLDTTDTCLFVYGSLLKGESHHHLLAKSLFLGRDALTGMQLFDLGAYPMIYLDPEQCMVRAIGSR